MELEKGVEAVIMVTFEAAKVENANDPEKVMECMKRVKRVPDEMSLETFVSDGYYAELRGEYVYKRVRAKHLQTKKELKRILPKNTIIQAIPISNLFLLKNTPGTFEMLKDRPDIVEINTNQKFLIDLDVKEGNSNKLSSKAVSPSRMKRLDAILDRNGEVQWNVRKISADKVWAQGERGEGLTYAIADTGASFMHPVLNRNYRGRRGDGSYDHNYSWWDGVREKVPFASKSTCPVASRQPCDDQGHGTHCLSTAAGLGGYGVAPGVKWIGCRNMDAGLGSTVTYLSCLNFFLAPHDLNGKNANTKLRPHVIGNSWGCPDFEGCSKHAMTSAVEILRAAGIFMSVSAGNEGPDCETITAPPSFEPTVITVGAVDSHDNLASFSSRGPIKIDGLVYRKPDLVAPGVGVMGAHLNGSYRRLSGTSMASPHIGGAVALMGKSEMHWIFSLILLFLFVVSNCPCLIRDIDRIQAILESTAVKLLPTVSLLRKGKLCGEDTFTSYPNNYFGYGRIDVLRAVETCKAYCATKPGQWSSSPSLIPDEKSFSSSSSNLLKK